MLEIYTDGACVKNPGGKGAWSYVIFFKDCNPLKYSQGYESTTNNRMELLAVIMAASNGSILEKSITIFSDSKYVVDGWNSGTKKKERAANWTRKKDITPNKDLWEQLFHVDESFPARFTLKWVPGHIIGSKNEIADGIAERVARVGPWIDDVGYGPAMKAEYVFKPKLGTKRLPQTSPLPFGKNPYMDAVAMDPASNFEVHATWGEI